MAGKGPLARICASIGAESPEAMAAKAERALSLGADLVEFRIDMLERQATAAEIGRSLRRYAKKAVVTVRPTGEGGRFAGGERERLGLISGLAEIGPAFLDIELSAAAENERWLRSLPTTVDRIVSWHDFEGTPAVAELNAKCRGALERGAVAKIVTTATKVEDNLRTLRLCLESPGRVVSFCMGELGSVSRVMSMGMRAPIVYASLPNEAVAPGQLSVPTAVEFRELAREA